jgi:hypothetical protein
MKAHDRDRRRAFPVISVGEQMPSPGRHAEGLEEIAGDVLAVARIDWGRRSGAPDAQIGIAYLEGRQVSKSRGVGLEQLVGFPRKKAPIVPRSLVPLRVPVRVAAENGIADSPELLRSLHRQRAQHDLVDQRENGGRRPDTERKSEHGSQGKAGSLAQAAESVADVGEKGKHRWPPKHVCLRFMRGAVTFPA